jgi:hypothetical protein
MKLQLRPLADRHPESGEEIRALIAERDRLREALQVILTDHAQDAFEDPIGHAERSANNWCRIGMGVITVVRAALAPDTAKEGT